MKAFQRSHFFVVFSLFVVASSIWLARVMFVNAYTEVLKPTEVTDLENLINPVTGETDGSLAFDFNEAGDRTTYASVYLNDAGQGSDVLFHDFSSPTTTVDSFVLGLIYNYKKGKGDDGFLIEYSTSGNPSCSDAGSRTWNNFGVASREKGKMFVQASLENVAAEEVCVRVSRVTYNDADPAGYHFRDSNALNIYDIWMMTPDANVQVSVLTEGGAFGAEESFIYHLQAANTGTGAAESVAVSFVLPEDLEYISAIPSQGFYNPATGVWEIGRMEFGDSETLEVTAMFGDVFVADTVQTTAAVNYWDPTDLAYESHASSTVVAVSETPSGLSTIAEAAAPSDALETRICDADCSRTGFFLYIVNPDGTIRDTISEYAKVTEIEPKYFIISFEDSGSDFDYNDIAFELDVRDCTNVHVTETKLNAGWHHEVRANILYDGEVKKGIVVWPDSQTGIGQTKTYNLEQELESC